MTDEPKVPEAPVGDPPFDPDKAFAELPEAERAEVKARADAWIRGELDAAKNRAAVQATIADGADARVKAWTDMVATERKTRAYADKAGRRAYEAMARDFEAIWGTRPPTMHIPMYGMPSRDTRSRK